MRGHSRAPHRKRRTFRRRSTVDPCHGRSRKIRAYRRWRELEEWWQAGQYATELEKVAVMRTRPSCWGATELSCRQHGSGRRACTWFGGGAICPNNRTFMPSHVLGQLCRSKTCTEIAGEPKSDDRTQRYRLPTSHVPPRCRSHFRSSPELGVIGVR